MTDAVSVVMCTRNGLSRGYLETALKSVFDQTSTPSEVLLIDDGSTDGTAAEVRRTFPGVTILKNARSGLAAARNTGIRAARNEWIAFIDDDDVWCPTKLSEQLGQIASSVRPESTIFAALIAFIGKGGDTPIPVRVPVQYASWPACLLVCPVLPSGVMLSRELHRRMGLFKENISAGSANEYWTRCLSAGATVRFSADVLVYHRRHHSQMSSKSRALALELVHEALVLPYIEGLPPALAERIKAARILRSLRGFAWHHGFSSAARFWADTPLRRTRLDVAALIYFVLDSVAVWAPHFTGGLLRTAAIRLLFGDYRCTDR